MTKEELRAESKRLRATIPPGVKAKLDEAIRARIVATKEFREAETVLLYVPVRGEIDLLPLVAICRREGKKVAFPVTDPEQGRITFRSFLPGASLNAGAYRIPEPPHDAPVCLADRKTLCILPGLTFDLSGNRLGYGKGYYDRYLKNFPGVTLGAVYERLMVDKIPAEAHDRKVDILVNERGTLDCKKKTVAGTPDWFDRAKERVHTWLMPIRKTVDRWLRAPQGKDGQGSATRHSNGAEKSRNVADDRRVSERTLPANEKSDVRPLHAPPALVLVTFGFLLLSRLIDAQLTRRGSEYISVVLLQVLIFVLPAVLYVQLRGERFPERIRMRPVRIRHTWICFCAFVMMVCGSLLISIMTGGVDSLNGNFTLYDTFVARINGSAWETVYVIIAYCLLPAFCEEFVYRSILCAEYEGVGTGVAVFVSALFFAMLHFSFPLFLNYLFLGILLAGMMYVTRSALAPMLLHFCYNLFCLFGQPYLSAFYVNAGSGEIFIFCLVVLLLLFAAFAAGEARKIYYSYAKADLDSGYTVPVRLAEYPRRILRALLSPFAGAVVLVWLVMAVISILH